MKYFLRHITQMRLSVAVLLLTGALCMWIVDYVRTPNEWLQVLVTQCMVLLNAGVLCTVLYRAKATARFSLVPAILYIVTIGIFPFLRVHWQPQLIAGVLLFFLLTTRDISDAHEPNGLVFFATVLLCLTALLVPDAVWCIPFLWIVVLLQGAFSLRTIFASLLGVLLVAIYYALAIYAGWAEMWDTSVLVERVWIGNSLPLCLSVTTAILLIAFIVITACAFIRSTHDLVSTRVLLDHAVILGLISAPLVLFTASEPDCWVLLPLSMSATTGVFLLQKESEARGVTLFLYLIGAPALYVWLLMSL